VSRDIAVVADRFGPLGTEQQPITVATVAGIALPAAGTWLVMHK